MYSVFNFQTGKWVGKAETKEELIGYIAKFNAHNWWRRGIYNTFLEDIAMSPNDKKSPGYNGHNWEELGNLIPRKYMVIDEFNRIIDPRDFKNEIFNYKGKPTYSRPFKTKGEPRKVTIIFRYDPLPGIGRHFRWRSYRTPRVINNLRKLAEPEYIEFTRKKDYDRLKMIKVYWDDEVRNDCYSKCWKDKKIKRQWMKHIT